MFWGYKSLNMGVTGMNVERLKRVLEELRSMLPMSEKEFGKVFFNKTGCVWSEVIGNEETVEKEARVEDVLIYLYRNYPIVIMCKDSDFELKLSYYILMLGKVDGYVIHFDFDKIDAMGNRCRNVGEK